MNRTRLFEALPSDEKQAIDALVEQAAAHFDGSLRAITCRPATSFSIDGRGGDDR